MILLETDLSYGLGHLTEKFLLFYYYRFLLYYPTLSLLMLVVAHVDGDFNCDAVSFTMWLTYP